MCYRYEVCYFYCAGEVYLSGMKRALCLPVIVGKLALFLHNLSFVFRPIDNPQGNGSHFKH